MDWFAETFGECPHGGIKPYCPQCAGDELEAKREERAQKQERRKLKRAERRAAALSVVVDNQSSALDSASRRIEALQNEVFRLRSRRLPWRNAR